MAEDWRTEHDRALVQDARELLQEATDRLSAVITLLIGEPGHHELGRLVNAARKATDAARQRADAAARELNRGRG